MTLEKQRIALAEFAGWRFGPEMKDAQTVLEPGYQARKEGALLCWVKPENEWFRQERIPDYLHDLNAVHVVIVSLTNDQKDLVIEHVAGKQWHEPWTMENEHAILCARASVLCEGVLRAIGKWKESE